MILSVNGTIIGNPVCHRCEPSDWDAMIEYWLENKGLDNG